MKGCSLCPRRGSIFKIIVRRSSVTFRYIFFFFNNNSADNFKWQSAIKDIDFSLFVFEENFIKSGVRLQRSKTSHSPLRVETLLQYFILKTVFNSRNDVTRREERRTSSKELEIFHSCKYNICTNIQGSKGVGAEEFLRV